ncbi:tyrosine-type recombinase/integrase [Petrotoga sp. DB-2]
MMDIDNTSDSIKDKDKIEGYISEFLSYLKFVKRRADSTIYEYKKILNNYKKFVQIYGLTRGCFLKYLEEISNLSQRTIKLRIVVLKSFLNYLYENGEISGKKYWKDANAKIPSDVPKGLTESQIKVFFSVIEDKFDKTFYSLLLKTGLRISEALSLEKEHIIFYDDHAELVINGKGNRVRYLKISKQYAEQLVTFANGKKYIFSNDNDVPITSRTMERRFQDYVIKANKKIDQIRVSGYNNINYINGTPHALRHTCAKRLLNSGKNLEEVRYILGHTTISTTGIYVRSDSHSSVLDQI